MSYKENNQEKFIKDTFNKLHTNITQFLLDTNYSKNKKYIIYYKLITLIFF